MPIRIKKSVELLVKSITEVPLRTHNPDKTYSLRQDWQGRKLIELAIKEN